MNSVKIRVPRNLIKRLYSHAEQKYEGYFFADLVNGVHLELFYVEEGDFATITSDTDLIDYLYENQLAPRLYFRRNGVFALREILEDDYEMINLWRNESPISIQIDIPKESTLPNEFILCFQWVEVGHAKVKTSDKVKRLTIDIYMKEFISMIDIAVALNWIK